MAIWDPGGVIIIDPVPIFLEASLEICSANQFKIAVLENKALYGIYTVRIAIARPRTLKLTVQFI